MKKIPIFIISALALLFIACSACTPAAYEGKDPALYTAAIYNVVGWQRMGASTERLDEDKYGRILYKYSVKDHGLFNDADNDRITAYIIVQKMDENYVWYYQDICFELFTSNTDISNYRIEQLKCRNHWNEEWSEEDLVCRKIWSRFDKKFSQFEIEGIDNAELDPSNSFFLLWPSIKQYYNLDCDDAAGELFDIDNSGKKLFYFRTFNDLEKGEGNGSDSDGNIAYKEAYFLVVDSNDMIDISSILVRIENPYNYQVDLMQLRKNARWETYSKH